MSRPPPGGEGPSLPAARRPRGPPVFERVRPRYLFRFLKLPTHRPQKGILLVRREDALRGGDVLTGQLILSSIPCMRCKAAPGLTMGPPCWAKCCLRARCAATSRPLRRPRFRARGAGPFASSCRASLATPAAIAALRFDPASLPYSAGGPVLTCCVPSRSLIKVC